MLVGSAKTKFDFHSTKLEVDTWKVSHNQDGSLIETFQGKTDVEDVEYIIYLGVDVSSDGKNTNNIIHKRNKAFGTQKQIMQMLRESGTYTIECGFIYLNSLLRGSILYAAEAMMNVTEQDFRNIDLIEEGQMRMLFATSASCPIHLMYLESGQILARFQMKRMMINFYQYILH